MYLSGHREQLARLQDAAEGPVQPLPLPEWASLDPRRRIGRLSSRLMRVVCRGRERGMARWELEQAAQSLLDALETGRRR